MGQAVGVKRSIKCLFCRCTAQGVAQEEISKVSPKEGALGTPAGGFACGVKLFLGMVWDGHQL